MSDIQDLIHSTMMAAFDKGNNTAIERCVTAIDAFTERSESVEVKNTLSLLKIAITSGGPIGG